MDIRLIPASYDKPEVALRGDSGGQLKWNV